MDEPSSLPERSSNDPSTRGGIDIQGGDIRAGRDIVGGDVNVAGDSISGQTVSVQRGFSANEVQRLILIVGGLVFATAACFFIFGAVSAAAFVGIINTPLDSSIEAARSMEQKINALNSLQSGQRFRVNFTEDEISSYFRFLLGPAIGVNEGKVRFTTRPGEIVIGGNLVNAGNLPFLANARITTDPMPLQLQNAWIKILPTPDGWAFGWVPVTPVAQDLNARINRFMFGRVQFTGVNEPRPEVDGSRRLVLDGVAK